eukprot:355142-Chlamydomonas_euryale.AAC.5
MSGPGRERHARPPQVKPAWLQGAAAAPRWASEARPRRVERRPSVWKAHARSPAPRGADGGGGGVESAADSSC